jgi:hypothetical protein
MSEVSEEISSLYLMCIVVLFLETLCNHAGTYKVSFSVKWKKFMSSSIAKCGSIERKNTMDIIWS